MSRRSPSRSAGAATGWPPARHWTRTLTRPASASSGRSRPPWTHHLPTDLPQETPPTHDTPPRWTLRDLPLSARVTIAAFLISVGVGYFSAIVQLHFQHAEPGSMLPTGKDAVRIFHGHTGPDPISAFERLLLEEENKSFNGSGQMVAAFTKRSEPSLKSEVKKRANPRRGGKKRPLDEVEKELRAERMAERD